MHFVVVLVVGLGWGGLSFFEETPSKASPSMIDAIRYNTKAPKKYLASLDLCMRKFMVATAWLAQLGERQSAVREVEDFAPDWSNTQGLKITEKSVLPL